MINTKLIKALRCGGHNMIFHYCDKEDCPYCQYSYSDNRYRCNVQELGIDAADALEAADEKIADYTAAVEALDDSNDLYIKENERLKKRIAELERQHGEQLTRNVMLVAQMPKEGEWIVTTEVSDDGAVTSHINCSRCGFYWRESKHGKVFKRCPNCGARMKESKLMINIK